MAIVLELDILTQTRVIVSNEKLKKAGMFIYTQFRREKGKHNM